MGASSIKPVRVGLIGYGYSGKTFHAPLIQSTPGLALCLVSSSNAERVMVDLPQVRVVADPFDVTGSKDVDLVVIASPNDSHAPLAEAALCSGKHVVVDKPFTVRLADARLLALVADEHDRVLSVFHNRRWDSDYLSVRRAIAQGLIGRVSHFESRIDRFRPTVRDRWREGDGPGSGLWFDLGPHLLDQALQTFGLPDRVTARLARLRAGAVADDWAHVVLAYPKVQVVLHATMMAAGGSSRFLVHGDNGSIAKREADRQEQQLLDGLAPGSEGWGQDPDPLIAYDHAGNQRLIEATRGDQGIFYSSLAKALRNAGPNPVPPNQAVAVMVCIEAAAASARLNRSVVPQFTQEERAAFEQ